MIQIPIKTRRRILRKARLFLAYGQCDYLCQAIHWSYVKMFDTMSYGEIINHFPEVIKRKPTVLHFAGMWFFGKNAKQDRINLLSDAINEINQKVKEESRSAGHGMDEGDRQRPNREKALYNANVR